MSIPIVCAMATHPARKQGLLTVVDSILPQCDKLCICLNNYNDIPEELQQSPKIQTILTGKDKQHPDYGSHGKFYWVDKEDDCYYLTVDDDIIYPKDYTKELIAGIDKYQGKAIVGYHGTIYKIQDNSPLPENTSLQLIRSILPFRLAIPNDTVVHVLGSGAMGCRPKTIGLTFDVFKNTLYTGDDEDVAIWAQKNNIPLIRLHNRPHWIESNDKIDQIEPLHRKRKHLNAAAQKLRSYKNWRLIKPEHANITIVIDETKIPKKEVFDQITVTDQHLNFCYKILSSDALSAIIIHRIQNQIPTSVIRMADGERAIIHYNKTNEQLGYLRNDQWLTQFGVKGIDLKKLGEDLIVAGNEADFFGASISGIALKDFDIVQYFPERKQFIDVFYPTFWMATDRVGPVLRAASGVIVLHRNAEILARILKIKYDLNICVGIQMSSWRDHESILYQLYSLPFELVLMSGGPSGKPFAVRLAKETKKIVLDIGQALENIWAKPKLFFY